MMNFTKDFNKMINKMDGITTDTSPPRYWFSSGNYVLNKIVSGNFESCIPQGRVTALAGPSGAGKSFLLANFIKQAQKEGAYILLLDSESAFDDGFAAAIGIDVEDPNYNPIQVTTIPQVIKIVSSFIKGYKKEFGEGAEASDAPKVLIAIDSLDMLQTDTEADKYERGDANADQGQHPKQIKQMLKTFVGDLKTINASMIVTKQVYAASRDQILKGEGVWVVNDAVRYSLSQIILITKLKLKGKDADEGITGIRMKCEAFKTRFTKPFQTVTIEVPYDTGMNPLSGLLEVAVGLGVVKKAGSYVYLDGDDKNKWYAREINDYVDRILQLCNDKSNVFLKISDADAALEEQPEPSKEYTPQGAMAPSVYVDPTNVDLEDFISIDEVVG